MQALEVGGVENQALKNQIKKYIWLCLDDIQQSNECEIKNGLDKITD